MRRICGADCDVFGSHDGKKNLMIDTKPYGPGKQLKAHISYALLVTATIMWL